jgi:hypothetical protein
MLTGLPVGENAKRIVGLSCRAVPIGTLGLAAFLAIEDESVARSA